MIWKRLLCALLGHEARPGYRVDHPDVISLTCARCRFQWLKGRASGL